MGVLPLMGIAALMLFGFVVLMHALTHDPLLKAAQASDRHSARERRSPETWFRTRAQQAWPRWRRGTLEFALALRAWFVDEWWPRWRGGAREFAETVRAWAIVLAEEWWPRLRHDARVVGYRFLSPETRSGEIVFAGVTSLVGALVLIAVVH